MANIVQNKSCLRLMLGTHVPLKGLWICEFVPTGRTYVVHWIIIGVDFHMFIKSSLIHVLFATCFKLADKCLKLTFIQSSTFDDMGLL